MESDKRRRPMCWTDVFVDPSYTGLPALVRESPETLICTLIEVNYGRRIARIRQDVRAVILTPQLAGVLNAEAGSAGLQIVRRYVDTADDAFEITVTTHPADRFTFSMQMERSRE